MHSFDDFQRITIGFLRIDFFMLSDASGMFRWISKYEAYK